MQHASIQLSESPDLTCTELATIATEGESAARRDRAAAQGGSPAGQLVSAAAAMTKALQAAGGKPWRPGKMSTVLVAVLMTMPPLVVIFSGRIGDQAMWIKTAVDGIRGGN